MKPGETVRVACGECQIVFDMTVAPRDEWRELPEDESDADTDSYLMPDAACPFCGAYDLKPRHDLPTYVSAAWPP
jgi:hypothetical protein